VSHNSFLLYTYKRTLTGALSQGTFEIMTTSVAEPHHFYAAPVLGKNVATAPAAPVLPFCIARQNIYRRN
jgi:hypothetical protein